MYIKYCSVSGIGLSLSESVVSDLLNRKEVVSSWQPWGPGLDEDLDCGPSLSSVIAWSPAEPFVKQTSRPNCWVKWVRGSGVLYDVPYSLSGCFAFHMSFARWRMLDGVPCEFARIAILAACGNLLWFMLCSLSGVVDGGSVP